MAELLSTQTKPLTLDDLSAEELRQLIRRSFIHIPHRLLLDVRVESVLAQWGAASEAAIEAARATSKAFDALRQGHKENKPSKQLRLLEVAYAAAQRQEKRAEAKDKKLWREFARLKSMWEAA